jgi:hypothetical protein
MQTSKNKVYLYNTRDEIESKSVPYAVDDAEELEWVISRFVAWARMLPLYPDLAARYGTAHIRLATDLRAAVKTSRENRLYPIIVLPMSKYFSAKLLWATTQAVMMEPAFTEMMEQENQRWEEEFSI